MSEAAPAPTQGKYVRWTKIWHGMQDRRYTYCGRDVHKPGRKLEWRNRADQPDKAMACGKCFDV